MPSHTVGDQRWSHTGENEAGDLMYSRDYGGERAESGSDYTEWTNEQLSAELEARGLAKSGNKADLIARLQEDDG